MNHEQVNQAIDKDYRNLPDNSQVSVYLASGLQRLSLLSYSIISARQ